MKAYVLIGPGARNINMPPKTTLLCFVTPAVCLCIVLLAAVFGLPTLLVEVSAMRCVSLCANLVVVDVPAQ
jgi:hypothetical protein